MNNRPQEAVFSRFTTRISAALGRPSVFICAVFALVVWAVSGPLLRFSDTWQLIINTCTTIVTFLMVFIIQNTQNRDNLAINLKLEALMLELKSPTPHFMELRMRGKRTLGGRRMPFVPKQKRARTTTPRRT